MAETPSDLFGDLHIQLRRDMTGGNLIVDRNCTIKGNLTVEGEGGGGGGGGDTDWSKMPTATTEKVGGIVVGNGLTVVVQGGVTPGKVVGQLDLDFAVPTVLPSQAVPGQYDYTDDAHAATPKAAYSIAYWTATQLINTKITSIINGEGPQPTGGDLLPDSDAVIEYVTAQIDALELGDAAKKDIAQSIGVGQTGLVSGAQVYLYIDGLNLGNTYAGKSHMHPLSEIYWGGNATFNHGTTISANSTNSDLATGKAVYDYAAPKSHEHTLSQITDAGTAAGLDTGTGAGNIPVLDGAGKLSISMMPERVIGGEYLGEVADQAAMIAKSNATVGDFVKRTDTGTYWMLGINSDGAYATAANWFEYAGAVASVNGATGQVTQAQLGLETTLTTTSDVKFPSSKAVATYVESQLDDFTVDVDEVSIDYDGNGKLEVKDTFVIQVFDNIGGLKETSARETYLKQAATGITAWNNGTSYAIGDKVLNRGEIYRATAANQSKEPYAYSQGVTAVWEKYTIQGMIEDAGGGYEIDNITIVLNENDEMEVDEANLAADLTTNHGVASKDFVTAADKGKLNTTALMNAPAFVATNTYAVDDVVSHNGNLYKCILSYTSSYGPDAAPDGANGSTYWTNKTFTELNPKFDSNAALGGIPDWNSTNNLNGRFCKLDDKVWRRDGTVVIGQMRRPGWPRSGWEESNLMSAIFGRGKNIKPYDRTGSFTKGDIVYYENALYYVKEDFSNPGDYYNVANKMSNIFYPCYEGVFREKTGTDINYLYFGIKTYSDYNESTQVSLSTSGNNSDSYDKFGEAVLYARIDTELSGDGVTFSSSNIVWKDGTAPVIKAPGLYEIKFIRVGTNTDANRVYLGECHKWS